uniref:Uncharacterized protein n=1 Tax=Setaria viridis TaxID=4556 RepID=A0A4V6DCK5_SETVI|nr:hypothetical protein SEVIR_1G091250v2 [Setaria viridis]
MREEKEKGKKTPSSRRGHRRGDMGPVASASGATATRRCAHQGERIGPVAVVGRGSVAWKDHAWMGSETCMPLQYRAGWSPKKGGGLRWWSTVVGGRWVKNMNMRGGVNRFDEITDRVQEG